jgi:acetyltransferase
MAIVAEVETDGKRRLVGVGRLLADPEHREAEYAVLVADAWQGRGLGSLITDFCFEICSTWGIDRIYAETTADNQRMQNILRRHKFETKKATAREVLYQAWLRNGRAKTQRPVPTGTTVT